MSADFSFLDQDGLIEFWEKIKANFPRNNGTGASGTWGISISGNAATATTATNYAAGGGIATALAGKAASNHTHFNVVTSGDYRSVATKPSDYANKLSFVGLKTNGTIGSPASSATYNYLVGLMGWSDTSGGQGHELAFNNEGVFHRIGTSTTAWGSWGKLAYKSEIPTNNNQLTNGAGYITSAGSCAYATSAGNADTLDNLHASDLVRRNANSHYYPFVASAHSSVWYKITLPASGNVTATTQWHMISMDIKFGGPYNSGPNGVAHLAYYFAQQANGGTYSVGKVYAFCTGTYLANNISLKYNISNPMILYVKACTTNYNSISIQNLTVNDNGANYNFLNTTIESCSAPTCDSEVPIQYIDQYNYTGIAASATKFASSQSITLTGDITGTASSQAGWSIATTIGSGKVTNAMLAGSIANGKLANSSMTIAGTSVSLGGSISAATIGNALTSSSPAAFATAAGSAYVLVDGQGAGDNVGSATQPVYFASGAPLACTYTLGKSVPSDAVFTDHTYTAEKGITLSGSKFGHSNTAITAQTTQAVYPIKIDAYGHITAYGTAVSILSLGESSSTAYRGDRGKIAYDHSQSAHAPSDANLAFTGYDTTNKKIIGVNNSNTYDVISIDGIRSDMAEATTSAKGLMSTAMVTKLNGIATGATANTGTVTSVAVRMNGSTKGTITTSGTIDLGTVLTSHQDISGKAPNNHASTATTYGVGTSSNYGHVKLGAANQNGATATDGVCAPNGHTHSQYLTSHQSLSNYSTLANTIKSLSISGTTITYTKGDGATGTLTTQDTNTTYSASTGLTLSGTAFSVKYGTAAGTACQGNDSRLSDSRNAKDVYSWAKQSTKPSYSFSEISSRGEALLGWGGKNIAGNYGPIDAAMVGLLSANRTAFVPASKVTIEYSRDGGSTWTDYGASNDVKTGFFTDFKGPVKIGNCSSTYPATANYRVRVILNTSGAVYTELNKFIIYVSTNGSNSNWCTIDGRLQSNVESSTNTWTTFADRVTVNGWPGYNVINVTKFSTYGNSKASQYGQVRFTFGCDSGGTSSYPGLIIYGVNCYGGVGWTTPSTLAQTGVLYTYDINKNATFPAKVTAASFSGPLIGNATSASTATNANNIVDPDGEGEDLYYSDIYWMYDAVNTHDSLLSDSGWQTISGTNIKYRKMWKTVYLSGYFSATSGQVSVAQLPAGYRPAQGETFYVAVNGYNGFCAAEISINTSGSIGCQISSVPADVYLTGLVFLTA